MNFGTMWIVLVLAVLSGCATAEYRHDTYDDNGKLVKSVRFLDKHATSDGAALLLEKARELERTRYDAEAETRAADAAELSIEKGKDTSVQTRGGNVTSGFVGYGGGYGYGGYGAYGADVYSPGVSPQMVMIERAGRGGGGMLPTLGGPIVQSVRVPVDGSAGGDTDLHEQVQFLRQDVNELLRVQK